MSLVLDASLALAWYFQDEASSATDRVLDRVTETGAVVPALWRLELANGLQVAVRRGRISAAYRDASLADLMQMQIVTDLETDAHAWAATLQLAEKHELTLYDAAYLELRNAADYRLPRWIASWVAPLKSSVSQCWGCIRPSKRPRHA